jgi:hypothetical protein
VGGHIKDFHKIKCQDVPRELHWNAPQHFLFSCRIKVRAFHFPGKSHSNSERVQGKGLYEQKGNCSIPFFLAMRRNVTTSLIF